MNERGELALRGTAAGVHLVIALTLLLDGLMYAAQGRLNSLWDASFFGMWSLGSLRMYTMGLALLGAAVVQGAAAMLYVTTGHRVVAHVVLFGSVILATSLPWESQIAGASIAWPLKLGAGVAAAAVLLDLWPRPTPGDDEPLERDEDG